MKVGDTVEERVYPNRKCKIIRAREGSGNEVVFEVKFLHDGSVHSRHVRKLTRQKQLSQHKTNTLINKPFKTPQLNIVASDSSCVTMPSLLSSASSESSSDTTYSSPDAIEVPIQAKFGKVPSYIIKYYRQGFDIEETSRIHHISLPIFA